MVVIAVECATIAASLGTRCADALLHDGDPNVTVSLAVCAASYALKVLNDAQSET